jgi:hydroxyethylthiazole kinase-like uncharacterized protein yjeF
MLPSFIKPPVLQALFRRSTIRAFEQAWLAQAARVGKPAALMQGASAAVAKTALQALTRLDPQTKVVALVGSGANGQDALLALDRLTRQGFITAAWPIAQAADRVQIQGWLDALASQPHLVIDGFLGLGTDSQRPFPAGAAALIEAINRDAVLRIAVDLPSGLDPDTGALGIDRVAVRADVTVGLLLPNAGLRTGDAAGFTGSIVDHDLHEVQGLVRAPAMPEPDAWAITAPPHEPSNPVAHKGSQGNVLIIAGSEVMPGAAVLAALGATAMNSGKTWVATEAVAAPGLMQPQNLWLSWADLDNSRRQWPGDAVVIGPGLGMGPLAVALLDQALALDCALIIDADALNLLAAYPRLADRVATRTQATVLTPHPLEALRLAQLGSSKAMDDRWALLDTLVARFDCLVVLKGAGTLIGAPGQVPRVIPAASALLASAGSGDVLSGMLGAVLARTKRNRIEPLEAVCSAVYWHAQAAMKLQQQGERVLPIDRLHEAVIQARQVELG